MGQIFRYCSRPNVTDASGLAGPPAKAVAAQLINALDERKGFTVTNFKTLAIAASISAGIVLIAPVAS